MVYLLLAGLLGLIVGGAIVWVHCSMMLANERRNAEREEARMKELMTATVNGAMERFTTASNAQLKENGAEFAAFNRKAMAEILEPLKGQLKEYDEQLKAAQEKNARQEASMKLHVESMQQAAARIGADAGKFIANLKCNNKFQGDFGENRLAAVLEAVGMVRGADFELQSGENKKIPDCLVYDHVGRKICIIDAKMSWKDYDSAFATEDGEARKKALQEHVSSVRKQIKNLADKKYQEQLSPMREGYTYHPFSIMFVPSDGALMVALEQDPTIPIYAAEMNVYLASPLVLFGFLKMIEKGRPNYDVAKNVEKIVAEAKLVVERVDDVFDNLEDVEKHLKAAQKSLDTALDRATKDEAGRSIKGPANRLIKLGIKYEKAKSKAMAAESDE